MTEELDWRDMFLRYVELVMSCEGVSFLDYMTWPDKEWKAIGELVKPLYRQERWGEDFGEKK